MLTLQAAKRGGCPRQIPLEQAPVALRHLIEDRPFGKVTLTVDARSRHQGRRQAAR
jgi:hypothetical protein